MKLRAYFLIFIFALFLHVTVWQMFFALFGYSIFEQIDVWKERKFRDRMYDEEPAWEQDPDDPTREINGNMTRVRLPREHQIVVTRIEELFRRDRR